MMEQPWTLVFVFPSGVLDHSLGTVPAGADPPVKLRIATLGVADLHGHKTFRRICLFSPFVFYAPDDRPVDRIDPSVLRHFGIL